MESWPVVDAITITIKHDKRRDNNNARYRVTTIVFPSSRRWTVVSSTLWEYMYLRPTALRLSAGNHDVYIGLAWASVNIIRPLAVSVCLLFCVKLTLIGHQQTDLIPHPAHIACLRSSAARRQTTYCPALGRDSNHFSDTRSQLMYRTSLHSALSNT